MAIESIEALNHCCSITGHFANPASLQHTFGEEASDIVEKSRKIIADALKCKATDVIFTSGATESNNLALKGFALANQSKGNHIITSASEHKSVLDTCRHLECIGFDVTYLKPDTYGNITIQQVLDAITDSTILVSLMHVNNETGVIQDIFDLAEALASKGICFHVDAAQSAGKLSIDLDSSPIHLLSVSGHKIYGPKGIGCLFIRNRKKMMLSPLLHGGGQEFGLRPGTLPTHQIAGFATAFELANSSITNDYHHTKTLEKLLIDELNQIEGIRYNGDLKNKLPNIVNVSFEHVGSDSLLIALRDEVAIASGSACNTGAIEASHVLRSMGIEGDRLYGAVRISFGRYTTVEEISEAGQRICEEVTRLRELG